MNTIPLFGAFQRTTATARRGHSGPTDDPSVSRPAPARPSTHCKSTVEPVFGIIKSVMGFRQFLTRGLANVQGEWTLVCLAWHLKRMAVLRPQ